MNVLNDRLKETIKKQEELKEKINIKPFILLISFGIQIILVYLFFIYLIGNVLASLLDVNNLYFLAIILGTIANINSVIKIIKGLKNAK
ncbi:MAG: hypothetical protein PHY80_00170 [Rickettsiales bacterium]|nr:hypothetical protein [Rickettsiales bacterium]